VIGRYPTNELSTITSANKKGFLGKQISKKANTHCCRMKEKKEDSIRFMLFAFLPFSFALDRKQKDGSIVSLLQSYSSLGSFGKQRPSCVLFI